MYSRLKKAFMLLQRYKMISDIERDLEECALSIIHDTYKCVHNFLNHQYTTWCVVYWKLNYWKLNSVSHYIHFPPWGRKRRFSYSKTLNASTIITRLYLTNKKYQKLPWIHPLKTRYTKEKGILYPRRFRNNTLCTSTVCHLESLYKYYCRKLVKNWQSIMFAQFT